MDGIFTVLIVAAVITIILVGVIGSSERKRKNGKKSNYHIFLSIGIIFLIIGAALGKIFLGIIGLVFLILSLERSFRKK